MRKIKKSMEIVRFIEIDSKKSPQFEDILSVYVWVVRIEFIRLHINK